MERQRRRLKTHLLGYDAGGQTFWSLLNQQPKYRKAMLMRESAQRRDDFRGLHKSVRYYEKYRNVKDGKAEMGALPTLG